MGDASHLSTWLAQSRVCFDTVPVDAVDRDQAEQVSPVRSTGALSQHCQDRSSPDATSCRPETVPVPVNGAPRNSHTLWEDFQGHLDEGWALTMATWGLLLTGPFYLQGVKLQTFSDGFLSFLVISQRMVC